MNEMQLLEEFRAAVAPPDPGTLARPASGCWPVPLLARQAAAHGGRACLAGGRSSR